MTKNFIIVLLGLILPIYLVAQNEVRYEISFDNAAHHEAEVQAIFTGIKTKVLEVKMSNSSPGYYALFNFSKNIYNFRAFNSAGKPLTISKPDQHQWNITNQDGTIVVHYTLYGDYMDGTFNSIESRHVYFNIPATFVWAGGFEKAPVRLTIKKPQDKWTIITQLVPTADTTVFTAPNLDYFIDSPVEITDFDLKEWKINSNGKDQRIKLALHHEGTQENTSIYAKLIEAIVYEETGIFGQLPEFDYGEFTFICNHLPSIIYDGMEHRNSTILTSTVPLRDNYIRNLRTVAHEFIHVWNGERLRPKSLQPFNLEITNMSGELWFLEGFTTYYQDLVVLRAGIIALDDYCDIMKSRINYVYNSPGYTIHSLVEMSEKAVLFNGGSYVDNLNLDNIFISYYTFGAMAALGLDLQLRKQYKNISLDDYMKLIWNKFGKKEIFYTNADLQNLLAELTKDKKFAETFFNTYIYGKELPNLKELYTQAGLLLRNAKSNKAYIGRLYNFKYDNNKTVISNTTLLNEPLYKAGLDKGDLIKEIDNMMITKQEDLEKVLMNHQPGDKVHIKYQKSGIENEADLILEEDPELELVPYETTELDLTPAMKSFRTNWLDTKTTYKLSGIVKQVPGSARIYPFEYNYCPYTGKKLEIKLTPEKNTVDKSEDN